MLFGKIGVNQRMNWLVVSWINLFNQEWAISKECGAVWSLGVDR